jgi:hypothetical protein
LFHLQEHFSQLKLYFYLLAVVVENQDLNEKTKVSKTKIFFLSIFQPGESGLDRVRIRDDS